MSALWQLMARVVGRRLTCCRLARSFPVLVVTGTEDKLVREANSHTIARILGVPVLVLKGAGHGLLYERREQVCWRACGGWLQGMPDKPTYWCGAGP